MHLLIAALWKAAQAACKDTYGTEYWTNNAFLSTNWAPFLVQQDVTDNTFYQQVQGDCGATYVMCPSINEANMQQLSLQTTCQESQDCLTLYKTAITTAHTTREHYHDNILKKFAYQLHPPTNGVTEAERLEYLAANAHIARIYGD